MAARDDAWTVMVCRPRYFPRLATHPPTGVGRTWSAYSSSYCLESRGQRRGVAIHPAGALGNGGLSDIESSLVRAASELRDGHFHYRIPKKTERRKQAVNLLSYEILN
jgi:reverse gyrase